METGKEYEMREDNIAMLQDTLQILESGYYQIGSNRVPLKLTRGQMEEALVFLPSEVRKIEESTAFDHTQGTGRCVYSCERVDSFSMARKLQRQFASDLKEKPVLVLNLANPVNPGGGVRRGARAQEEDLCRKSSLLLSLEGPKAGRYYGYNRSLKTFMGTDAVMIHPQVEIIKDEQGNLLDDSVVVSVMTCAAPHLRFGMEGLSQAEYEAMLLGRMTGMLKVAAYLGYRYLVLGAWGCGAFYNDARVVSDLFRKALDTFDHDDMFRRVDFAVLDHSSSQYNFRQFARNFARS